MKRLRLFSFFIQLSVIVGVIGIVLFLFSVNANAEDTTGLISWWKLDEGTGTNIGDSCGSNDGTIVDDGDVPTFEPGVSGTALHFHGGDGVDAGWGRVPQDDSMEVHTGDYTIEMWMKRDSTYGSAIIQYGGGYGPSDPGYKLAYNKNAKNCSGAMGSWDAPPDHTGHGSFWNNHIGDQDIEVDTWYHLALVFDRDDKIKLYVNGVQSGVGFDISLYSAEDVATKPADFYFGGHDWHGDMDGMIDELRIWDVALTQEQIEWFYNHPGKIPVRGTLIRVF